MTLAAHWLRIRAVAHPTEDVGRVEAAMQALLGTEAPTRRTEVTSQHGGRLVILEAELRRNQDIRAALDRVLGGLAAEAEARTDDEGVFHARFDKQAAAAGEVQATQGDDAIHLRVKPNVHPATREAAAAAITDFGAS